MTIHGEPNRRNEEREPSEAAPPREGGLPELARELAGLVERAGDGPNGTPLPLRDWVDLTEAWYITRALRRCGGNRSAAARSLGIGRRTLYAKMEKLGIQPTWNATGLSEPRRAEGSSTPEPPASERGTAARSGLGGIGDPSPIAASGN